MTAPTLLPYDDLPPGSDIRRVYERDVVQVTVPAGPVPATVLKQTAYDALASGAASSWALLLLSFIIFYLGLYINRISGTPLVWAWAFFAVFCTALVLLAAWVRYGTMTDAIRAGRRQATVLAVTAQRVVIETSGPFATAGYDFGLEDITSANVTCGVMRDDRGQARRVNRLELLIHDGRRILLLPGRDQRELKWVASAIKPSG